MRPRADHSETTYVADVCGSSWWGALHGIAGAINCESCRDHAIELVGAMHDLVNWYLGKPMFSEKGFSMIAGRYAESLAGIDWKMDLGAADQVVAALPVELQGNRTSPKIDALPQELQGGHMAQLDGIFEQWASE